jgi:rubrerythrin
MAKDRDKEHKKLHQVYKAGDKYHCGECGTEVDYGKNCPMCKKELNWAQIEADIRRY